MESHGKLCSWYKITKAAYVVGIIKKDKKWSFWQNFENNCFTLSHGKFEKVMESHEILKSEKSTYEPCIDKV